MKNHIPIYIISLSSMPERRLHVKRQLDSFGLKCQFVNVDDIDKYELESKDHLNRIAQSLGIDTIILEKKYNAILNHLKASSQGKQYEKNKNNNLGSLAITLSHIKIYDLMVKHNHSEVCILEDDVTLLPTFPKILKIAPDLSWDILQLAHQPGKNNVWNLLASCIYKRSCFTDSKIKELLSFLRCWIGNHNDADKQALKLYGFDHRLYPAQAKYIIKTIREHRDQHRRRIILNGIRFILDTIMNNQHDIKITKRYYQLLFSDTIIKLGSLPEKTDLNVITHDHCIAEPAEQSLSTTAYIVRPAAAVKWKQKVLSVNPLVIDEVPWELHRNGQVKLRLVTPPCATATRIYLKYSARLR